MPRCGPDSATGPTVRSGQHARGRRRAGHGRRGGAATGRRCRPSRPHPRTWYRQGQVRSGAARPRARPAARPIPPARSGSRRPPRRPPADTESSRQPPDLWREPGGLIWPPSEDIGAVSIEGKRSASALATSRSSSHGSAAANTTKTWRPPDGRDVGEDLAAAPGHEPGEGLGLSADLGREDSVTFMMVLDSSIMNVTACAGRVKVKRQHPPGARARVIHRHRARLARRLGGQRPGMPGRVGAAAVTRDPDVRSTGNGGRYRTPGRRGVTRCPGERERARTRRRCFRILRRVVRGQ